MPNELTNAHWKIPKLLHTFFQTYLFITVLAFFFGPWNWIVYDPFKLVAFLAASQAAIWAGYRLSRLWVSRMTIADEALLLRNRTLAVRITAISTLLSLALLLPTSLSRTGNLIPDIRLAWENAGQAYNDNFDRITAGNPYVVVEYLRILLAPLLVSTFPLMMIFWRRLPTLLKAASLVSVTAMMVIYFSIGTNKGIADVVVMFPMLVVIARKINDPKSPVILTKENMIAIGSIIIFLIFFGITQETRRGNVGTGGIFNGGSFLIFADSAGVAENWSSQWIIIYESITRYLTQGYQALAFSFELTTPSTFGVGNSMFFAENINSLAGTDYFVEQSIPGQLDSRFGINRLVLWHSIYPWLASDFGYFGTILCMLIFSFMLFSSIFVTIRFEDPFFATLAYLLIILFFYIPANNQIFQTGETAVAFLVITALVTPRLLRYFPRGDARAPLGVFR